MAGRVPPFFVQGQGGTLLRQAVVLAAISGFVLTAAVFRIAHRRAFSPFARWYTLALILIATGLFGVLLQSTFGSVLNWTARAAQYLGGIYMLVAAVASIRDSRDWHSSLAIELSQARQRYEDLFHLAVDGIVVCEIPAGRGSERFVEANSALCALLGYTLPELRALRVLDIVAAEERESLLSLRLRDDAANRREITLVGRDGRRLPTEVSMRIFRDRGVPTVMAIVRDITERKAADQKVQDLAQRLAWHIENSPLAVIEWGSDMRLTRWSGEAEHMFGWTAGEVLGKRIEDPGWIQDDDKAGVEQIFRDARAGKPRSFSAHRICRRDGSVVHSEWHTSALLDENGSLRSILSLVLDVTSRVEAERSLRRLNSDLEQFAYAVSHDLQEPLRNVSIYSELLVRRHGPQLETQARQYVEHVVVGARRILSLLGGLRAYLHAATGHGSAGAEPTDCADCLNEVLESLAEPVSREGAIVTAGPLPSIPVPAVHLHQLLQNLIANALKFRSDAPPRISVTAEPAGALWRFSVQDNGIGIAPEYRSQIFGVFRRLHPQSRYEGSGIGLAICQKIVERHGGSIWVESANGGGACFVFTLPAHRTSSQPPDRELHAV
jgi:PAS domain S-box-containing protein